MEKKNEKTSGGHGCLITIGIVALAIICLFFYVKHKDDVNNGDYSGAARPYLIYLNHGNNDKSYYVRQRKDYKIKATEGNVTIYHVQKLYLKKAAKYGFDTGDEKIDGFIRFFIAANSDNNDDPVAMKYHQGKIYPKPNYSVIPIRTAGLVEEDKPKLARKELDLPLASDWWGFSDNGNMKKASVLFPVTKLNSLKSFTYKFTGTINGQKKNYSITVKLK